MIIRSLLRRPSALQCLSRAPSHRLPLQSSQPSRSLYNLPTLTNHLEISKNGIPGLFSPKQFQIAYLDYHQWLIDTLNAVTSGTQLENRDIGSLVVELARDPEKADMFNFASMAYNNHAFFNGIATSPQDIQPPSSDLAAALSESFSGSLDSMRRDFLYTADAMFGPGFVWLVQDNVPNRRNRHPFRILATYGAGSPLPGAHYRRQPKPMATESIDSQLNSVGAFGNNSSASQQQHQQQQHKERKEKPLGGVEITPVLCVNTWEHVWLHDYGVGGKMKYLEAWWDRIHWGQVADLAKVEVARTNNFIPGRQL